MSKHFSVVYRNLSHLKCPNTFKWLVIISLSSSQLKQEEWRPDYGPGEFVPRWGATVTGARSPLVAYNVNLLATKQQAHRIALNLREQGRGPKAVQCALA